MQLSSFVCPICGHDQIQIEQVLSQTGEKFQLGACLHCLHRFLYEGYTDYTSDEFSKRVEEKVTTPDKAEIAQLEKKAFERFNFYREFIDQADHFLEVGSSIGGFVHILRLYGKQAVGLEPDPEYAAFSQIQYGFAQQAVLLKDFQTPKQFGAACSFHVIEHVNSPQDFIRKISELLTEDGLLLIECPSYEIHNFGSMSQSIRKSRIHYFSVASLYHLLSTNFMVEEAGYYGSAIYVKARKSNTATFNKQTFARYKRQTQRIFTLNRLPAVGPKLAKQLMIQSVVQKGKFCELIQKASCYAPYQLKRFFDLKRERGNKGQRVFHVTYYKGWGANAGDDVLSKCVRDVLRQDTPRQFSIQELDEPVTQDMIAMINQHDLLVVGGGGLLLPDTNANTISGWQWAISAEEWNKISIPLIAYAIGYNYFRGQTPNDFFIENLHHFIRKASFFGLRNHGSIRKVNELTNNSFQDKVCYQPCPTTVIRKFHQKLPPKQKSKNIAINVAFDRPMLRFGQNYEAILMAIATALKKLSEQGYQIFNATHVSVDQRIEIVFDRIGLKYQTVKLQHVFPQQVYEFYNQMELVLGMRGHAQMIPFGLNTKILSLGTHDKIRWFIEDIGGIDHLYVELHDRQSEDLSELIYQKAEAILNQNSRIVNDLLLDAQEHLWQTTQENLKFIREISI